WVTLFMVYVRPRSLHHYLVPSHRPQRRNFPKPQGPPRRPRNIRAVGLPAFRPRLPLPPPKIGNEASKPRNGRHHQPVEKRSRAPRGPRSTGCRATPRIPSVSTALYYKPPQLHITSNNQRSLSSSPTPNFFRRSEMAASQMEELKKAYAGIILHTQQESAARQLAMEQRMAAQRAAVTAAKEEGVAMVVRVKAMMEAKIKEEELRSSQYVKKIKELEAQQSLQLVKIKVLEDQVYGFQNDVATLQTELQGANTELEQARKMLSEERINRLHTSKKIGSNKHTSSRLKMNLQSRSMSLNNKNSEEDTTAEENVAAQNIESIYHRSPDLPSSTEGNKKPRLYHSGCTQRIHALRQRNKGADACQEQKYKYATALKSRSKIRKNDAAKKPSHTRSIMEQILQTKFLGKCKRKRGTRSRPCYKHDSSGERREAEDNLSETSNGNGCLLLLQALEQDLSSPKVSSGVGGEALPLTDLKDGLVIKREADQNLCNGSLDLMAILSEKNMLVKRKKRSKTVRVLEADFSDSKSVAESSNTLLRSTSEKSMSDTAELISERKDNHSDIPPRNSGPVLQHIAENLMHQTGANNGKSVCENSSAVLLQSTKSETIDYGNLLVEQLGHKTPDTSTASSKEVNGEGSYSLASEKADASTVLSLGKEENLKVPSVLPTQASEKHNASVGSSLYKEKHAKASGASMQVEGVRPIIYTFNRRKRKSVAMDSTPLRAVPEKSSNMLSAPAEGEFHQNPEQQDNLIDSPQGDNQLVQIANQLILLSELNC
ncbi:hypothetical protein EJB05_21111, partial [Eragrostis curvula]